MAYVMSDDTAERKPEPVTLTRQIQCVRRELALRESVYSKRVKENKMRQREADEELAAMRAVLKTLTTLKDECAKPDGDWAEGLARMRAAALRAGFVL